MEHFFWSLKDSPVDTISVSVIVRMTGVLHSSDYAALIGARAADDGPSGGAGGEGGEYGALGDDSEIILVVVVFFDDIADRF